MNPRLTLDQHAELVRHLIEMERSYWAMAPLVQGLPVRHPVAMRWGRIAKAIQHYKSDLENLLWDDHPDDARAIGFCHYGNVPETGDAAGRLFARASGSFPGRPTGVIVTPALR